MAGFTPNEGEQLLAQCVHQRIHDDKDADLELLLFTDSAPGETITEATINEPTGGGYARKDLTDASWSCVAGIASYALQQFEAVGSDYSAPIYGYAIATKSSGGTKRLLFVEIDSEGPHTMSENATYDVTLNMDYTVAPA